MIRQLIYYSMPSTKYFKCKVNKKNAETSLNAILKGLITIKTSFYNTKERKKCMSEK